MELPEGGRRWAASAAGRSAAVPAAHSSVPARRVPLPPPSPFPGLPGRGWSGSGCGGRRLDCSRKFTRWLPRVACGFGSPGTCQRPLKKLPGPSMAPGTTPLPAACRWSSVSARWCRAPTTSDQISISASHHEPVRADRGRSVELFAGRGSGREPQVPAAGRTLRLPPGRGLRARLFRRSCLTRRRSSCSTEREHLPIQLPPAGFRRGVDRVCRSTRRRDQVDARQSCQARSGGTSATWA